MVRKVVVLAFPGVQGLDVVGPFDVFTGASRLRDGGYEVVLASAGGLPVSTGTGLVFVTGSLPSPDEPVDTVVLPGGAGVDDARASADVITWIRSVAPTARRIVSARSVPEDLRIKERNMQIA
ncbi:MAG: DJ-1/PfpI family protein, partial [Mycobacteriaceae bacterium]|nr:DJ-1/PfpI family protein [Mycobacteriaceae bacterium]